MRCQTCQRLLPPAGSCPDHPGQPATTAPGEPAPPPPELPGLTHWRLLGQGGFASVFGARSSHNNRLVAVKVSHSADDARFSRECRVLTALGPPLTPEFLHSGQLPDGRPYLVMEQLTTPTLAEWMCSHTTAPAPATALGPLRALCSAVDQLHAAGYVHRDLKPENIFVAGRIATLIDFGLTRSIKETTADGHTDDDLTSTGARIGTLLYMAPEQCHGQRATCPSVDIYACGIIAHELLGGRPPFGGDAGTIEQGHLTRRPPPLSEQRALPAAVDEVLQQALAKQPADRFATATSFAEALTEALAEQSRPQAVPRTAPTTPTANTRRQVALLALQTSAPGHEVKSMVGAEQGTLITTVHGRYVIAFPELPPAGGVRAALAIARQLETECHRAIVHTAEVRCRVRSRGIMIVGAAVDRSDSWWTNEEQQHTVLLTEQAARQQPVGTTCATAVPGWFRPADRHGSVLEESGQSVPLYGRSEQLQQLQQAARHCVDHQRPTLVTMVGQVGVGKSRLLDELATRLPSEGFHTITVRPTATGAPLLLQLVTVAMGLAEGASDEQVRAACQKTLPEPMHPLAMQVLPQLLRPTGEQSPQPPTAPLRRREQLARVVGTALREQTRDRPLALLIDDLHRADFGALDALELATQEGGPAALFVAVAARLQFREARASWGTRATATVAFELGPLETAEATALLADLLRPVEYIPGQVLAQLAELANGVPLQMVELSHALRATGTIRRRHKTESWYLASDELVLTARTPMADQLARRSLEQLPPHLRGMAQLCALLEQGCQGAELTGIVQELPADSPLREFDAGTVLESLVGHGLLRADRHRHYQFRQPILRAAIARTLAPELRRALHAAAWRYLSHESSAGHAAADLAKVVHHAAACGETSVAARGYLALADAALAAYRYLDADTQYTAALNLLAPGTPAERLAALRSRARVRYTLERHSDALDDLAAARQIADEHQDPAAATDILLEQATTLDWLARFDESAAAAEQAIALAEPLNDEQLRARCQMAMGRTRLRQERWLEGIALVEHAVAVAATVGDTETQLVSLAMLGPALVYTDRLKEAEQRFQQAVDLCEQVGDRLHLGAIYGNRMILWVRLKDHDRAIADTRRALEIVRELGQVYLEVLANHNLGELLLWHGDEADAAELAVRARDLDRRLREQPRVEPALLAGRAYASLRLRSEAKQQLHWLEQNCGTESLAPSQTALFRMVELACATDPQSDNWNALVCAARAELHADERLELLHLRARVALEHGDHATAQEVAHEAEAIAADSPTWQKRFAALAELGLK